MLLPLLVACLLTLGPAAGETPRNASDVCERPLETLEVGGGAALAALLRLAPPLRIEATPGNAECRRHSRLFQEELRDMKTWALQMYDSSGRIGASLLNGNAVQNGDADQCIGVRRPMEAAPREATDSVTGRYCSVAIYLEPVGRHRHLHALLDLVKSHEAMSNSHRKNDLHLPSFSAVHMGACIPASCGAVDLERSVVDLLRSINISSGIDFRVRVDPHNCLTAPDMEWQSDTYATLAFVASLLLLVLVSTIFEVSQTAPDGLLLPSATKGTLRRVLVAFSLRRNWRNLVDMDMPSDALSCLHGVRFVASMMIFIIHKLVFNLYSPYVNRTYLANLLEGDWTMLFRVFWNWVDTFVVMSGLLTSYYAFRRLGQGRKLNLPQMYLQRYIKFTPMVAFWALLTRNLLQHQVSGENYTRFVRPYVQNCKRAYSSVLTYTSVFDGLDQMCYSPSHQLVTDMHMYLMAPLMVLFVWKMPRAGPATLAVLMVVLSAAKYFSVLHNSLGSFLYYGMSTETTVASANLIYVNAAHRLTPYLMGMALGWVLQAAPKLSAPQRAAGTAIAVACAAFSLFGVSHAARRGYEYVASEAAAFAALQPLAWSFALCWLVFSCATDSAPGWLRGLLCWRGFIIFSKLSYAIYLTQLYVIGANVGNAVHPSRFAIHNLLDLNEIAVVAFNSVLSTLVLLLPLQDLSGILFGTYKPPDYSKYQKGVMPSEKPVVEEAVCKAEE